MTEVAKIPVFLIKACEAGNRGEDFCIQRDASAEYFSSSCLGMKIDQKAF